MLHVPHMSDVHFPEKGAIAHAMEITLVTVVVIVMAGGALLALTLGAMFAAVELGY